MVRKNNKGFSLIEVVVAVAILTLLMAPIIQQVIQTLNTSAQAKERQYAIENAEYILNYMQETPVSKLNILSGKLGSSPAVGVDGKAITANIDGGDLQFTSYNKEEVGVVIWTSGEYASMEDYLKREEITEGKLQVALTSAYAISYNAATYTLDKEAMGRSDKFYQRKVIVDNLHAMVAAEGRTIETNFSAGALSWLKSVGFTITTEGAAVRYNEKGYVTDVVTSKVDGLRSPNGTGTSYMQDLDSSKVAIIQGTASNFDEQAENDLYNLKMAMLKKYNPDAWVQAMVTKNPDGSILDTSAYYNDNVSKMTRISIVSGYDGTRDLKYYDVDCTVFYEDYLIKSGTAGGEAGNDAAAGAAEDISSAELNAQLAKPQVLTYNAYSKRFYTNQAPDIYLVYEPYVARGSDYANKDYIVTYDGVLYGAEEKHSKLYIIKPNKGRVIKYNVLADEPKDWSLNYTSYFEKVDSKYVNVTAAEEAPSFEPNKYYERSHDFTTQLTTASDSQVMIYMNYIKGNAEGAVSTQIPVYTNITKNMFVCDLPLNEKDGVQYITNQDQYYGVVKSSDENMTDPDTKYTASQVTRTAYEAGNIHDISEDVTLSDRVYTITVQLDKLKDDGSVYSGYSVRLSGAKGAE
ncbi:MAG: prepilin-type N-terminal cleavage/methylation domain-containing protein [Eubacterium sp.]|nr:prepilin-type N-terminal cleavage/methylation domain-containing protein [Eubacterium sp.]